MSGSRCGGVTGCVPADSRRDFDFAYRLDVPYLCPGCGFAPSWTFLELERSQDLLRRQWDYPIAQLEVQLTDAAALDLDALQVLHRQAPLIHGVVLDEPVSGLQRNLSEPAVFVEDIEYISL